MNERLILLTCFTFLVSGCGGGAADHDAPVRNDSAGIEIVLNTASDRPLDWTFRESWRVGGAADGPEAFYRVERAKVAVDGRGHLYVLDAENVRVAEFSADGTPLRTLGSEGGGPGEFQRPDGIAVSDSGEIAVLASRRAVRFAPSGEPRATVQLGGAFADFAYAGDGFLVRRLGRPDSQHYSTWLTRLTANGDSVVLAWSPPGQTASFRLESCGFPLGRTTSRFFFKQVAWHASHQAVAVNAGVGYDVGIYDLAGTPRLIVRRDVPLRPATRELALQASAHDPVVFSSRDGARCIADHDEVVDKRGFEEYVPAIRNVALAPDGTLWVERWVFDEERRLVDVFDPAGSYLGTLPPNAPWPLEFTPEGHVVAKEKDDMDVERVVVFEVRRDSSRLPPPSSLLPREGGGGRREEGGV
jgi:hypothetical protein